MPCVWLGFFQNYALNVYAPGILRSGALQRERERERLGHCREPLGDSGLGTAGYSEDGRCGDIRRLSTAGRETLGLDATGNPRAKQRSVLGMQTSLYNPYISPI